MLKDLIQKRENKNLSYDSVKHRSEKTDSPILKTVPRVIQSVHSPCTDLPSRTTETAVPLRKSQPQQPLETKSTLLFCRYELKYRIPESKAQAVKAYIENFLPLDRYARRHPDGQYLISSLYFDSDNLDLCQETLQGKTNRFKLRIRAYNDAPDSPVFVEIKRRLNKIILKSRAGISRQDLVPLMEGTLRIPEMNKKEQEAIEQFILYQQLIQGHPVMLVRYMREAFEDDSESRVRITFDRDLSYKEMRTPEVTLNGKGWHPVPINFVILEIKFTDTYPAWLRDLVRLFNLNLSSMSKYVTSIKQSQQFTSHHALSYYME